MSKIEDILFEAHKEGIRENVLKMVSKLNETHYNMDVQDKVELAYNRVKTEKQQKQPLRRNQP